MKICENEKWKTKESEIYFTLNCEIVKTGPIVGLLLMRGLDKWT